MTNLEYLKKNFNKFKLYDEDLFCELAFICKTGERCVGFKYERCTEGYERCTEGCGGCQFRNISNAIDYLLQEHTEPIKLKQWEKDLISLYDEDDEDYSIDYNFNSFLALIRLKEKGYFKGITDASMKIQDILKNCEVIE